MKSKVIVVLGPTASGKSSLAVSLAERFGGTGLYIDTLLGTISLPEVPPNPKLRKILAGKSAPMLFSMLQKLDPTRAKNIDKHNKVRLVRAIEIAKSIGKVPKTWRKKTPYNVLYIGLNPKNLENRIKKRLIDRIKKGMISEVKNLHKHGLSWKRMETLGLEYRYISRYLRGLNTKESMIAELAKESIKYSRRQMTWFKTNKNIVWFDPTQKQNKAKIEKLLKQFLNT